MEHQLIAQAVQLGGNDRAVQDLECHRYLADGSRRREAAAATQAARTEQFAAMDMKQGHGAFFRSPGAKPRRTIRKMRMKA